MVSLIKGGNKEREVTSKDCRLTVLNTKCVKREGSLKWILMHKLQGVLEPQSYKKQWKEQTPVRKCLALIVFVLAVYLCWELQRLHDTFSGMRKEWEPSYLGKRGIQRRKHCSCGCSVYRIFLLVINSYKVIVIKVKYSELQPYKKN